MVTVDPVDAVGALVRSAMIAAFGSDYADTDPQVRRSDRADVQADLAMQLARRVKRAPRAIADAIAAAIPANDVIDRIEIANPGFLNVWVRGDWLARAASTAAASDRLGVPLADVPERVVVDYSHPNVAKEMHVGHLRSTVIGDALARVLEWRGHTVIRQNHIGDWGTPFGMLIEHLIDLGEAQAEAELGIGELAAFYKAARAKFDGDAAFAERSRKRVVALQAGDAQTLEQWRVLVDLSTRYFEAVYAKLGVTLRHGDIAGESFYNDRLAPLANELEASRLRAHQRRRAVRVSGRLRQPRRRTAAAHRPQERRRLRLRGHGSRRDSLSPQRASRERASSMSSVRRRPSTWR